MSTYSSMSTYWMFASWQGSSMSVWDVQSCQSGKVSVRVRGAYWNPASTSHLEAIIFLANPKNTIAVNTWSWNFACLNFRTIGVRIIFVPSDTGIFTDNMISWRHPHWRWCQKCRIFGNEGSTLPIELTFCTHLHLTHTSSHLQDNFLEWHCGTGVVMTTKCH